MCLLSPFGLKYTDFLSGSIVESFYYYSCVAIYISLQNY
jgi:hypothetical protein